MLVIINNNAANEVRKSCTKKHSLSSKLLQIDKRDEEGVLG